MKYILFVLMMNGNVATAEFNNERACEWAIRALSAVNAAWCMPKGAENDPL